jgi:uncharacterized protein YraI
MPRRLLPLLFAAAAATSLLSACAPASDAEYATTAEVALLSGQGEDASIVAWLPRGTPLVPTGQVDSHGTAAWRVDTPMGTGWVYTRFISLRIPDAKI